MQQYKTSSIYKAAYHIASFKKLDNHLKLHLIFNIFLNLPYLQSGQAAAPAQRLSRINSAQCASLNVTTRLQVTVIKLLTAVKP